MKSYVFIVLIIIALIGCGSPRFEVDTNQNISSTFIISYFFPDSEHSRDMKVEMPIIIIFSEPVDKDSAIKGLTIEKTGPGQKQNIKPLCTYNDAERMLECLPESKRWDFKSSYTVKIKDVRSSDGTKTLDKEYSFSFTTI